MVHIHNGIFSYKMNVFDSVLIKWRKLEPVIQIEVSQKEKNIVNTYIYGVTYISDTTDDPICKAAMQMQTYRTDLWTQWERERVG